MPIKIAVIGLGYWGPNLIRNFYQLQGCQISFACDVNKEKLREIKKFYPALNVIQDYKAILKDKNIQAVCVATPLSTHFAIAKDALLAGKDVFLEKPMTQSLQEAAELVNLAKEKNRILMVDHTFVYSGAVEKLKDFIQKGELGQLYYFDSERINLGLIRSDTNVIFDLASHDLSIIDYLFWQKPISVSAASWGHIMNHQGETASITLNHEDNFVSSIKVSWFSPVKIRKIVVAGSKKMVLYDDVEPDEKIRIYDKGVDLDTSKVTPFQPLYRSGDIVIPKLDQTEPLKKAALHFLSCCRQRLASLTDGEAGLRIVKILEAINMSIKKGGAKISL